MTRALQVGALALAVAVLVAGAALVGASRGEREARAVQLLTRLYAAGPAAVAGRLVPGSVPDDQRPALQRVLRQVVQPPFEATASDRATVRGVTLVHVRTDRIDWCVTPDDALVVDCRVGNAELDGAVRGAPVDVAFAALDVYPRKVDVAVVLRTPADRPVRLGGDPQLTTEVADYRLVEAGYLTRGRRIAADRNALRVQPGAGLLLVFTADGLGDVQAATSGPFTLRWDGATARLQVTGRTWLVGEGSRG
ncbi:MAG TPA: hypothetical protein VHF25_10535 [Nitriliruptorales bacterium]|nr:hypothetical protein [Nitriliruptorales bacterium]